MKKLFILLMSLFAMIAEGTGLNAQEVTIVLKPNWTWISYPSADTVDFATVLGTFTPLEGDIIACEDDYSEYFGGEWIGDVQQFYPGYGYMYYSNRTEPVTLTLGVLLSLVVVTTTEPTDINGTSVTAGGTVTIAEGNHIFARGVCWGTEEMPTVDGSHTSGEAVAGSQTVTLVGLSPNTTYYVRAYAVTDYGLAYGEEQSFTTEAGGGSGGDHAYVDLGLPSGLLWATCNVGADNPEDYGDYFAWGETQLKNYYYWSTYQYCNGSYYTLTKYCNDPDLGNGFNDNLTTLLPEDDAATANWGSDWRMPTKEEWQELYQNTTHMWTTQNGVNGRLFTSNNGNSLFLPAAGYRNFSDLDDAGSDGYYWSGSLDTDFSTNAWNFYFSSGNYRMKSYDRYCGLSVRPVRVESQNTSFSIDATASPSEGGTVAGTGNYAEGSTCTLIATAYVGYTFTNWTENGAVVSTDATYSFTVEIDRVLVANFAVSSGSDHSYVDLGLPSGTLWATCNVGANSPEDCGNYFAWGETQPKSVYNWYTYQYDDGSNLTKYTGNDGLTTLLPEDDAATANWGSDWRMPTDEEWQELRDNTTHTWTTQNGVNGMLFTALNGNSLFLPAAGYRDNSSLNLAGSYGSYWSSSLYTVYPYDAWGFYFGSTYSYVDYGDRYDGQSVRAVRVELQN